MPEFKRDEKSKKVMQAALNHYHTCPECQKSESYGRIGQGEAGCIEGQRLWRLSMLEFIRLHPQYKTQWDLIQEGKAHACPK